jgi:hypothetical protein
MDDAPATLEPRRDGFLKTAGRHALSFVSAMFGSFDTYADSDLIVRRRASGEVVLQTAADVGDPELLLEEALNDLAELTEEEFLEEWSAPRTN